MTKMSTEKTILFKDALGERYLSYALSTIMARSLPDVRDGLKPVHRRLIFAMRELKLDPKSSPKKCGRIVGDVLGKYHPHGDVAVYNALVRLAQDFTLRYPLVEGQGNFGNIDGDNAAAMRYTEARLTAVAHALMDGLDEDAVDLRETYDGEHQEPVVFPGKFPNLLANGSEGIAVGMATSIPPHNVKELCGALTHLIDYPDCEVQDLLEFVMGPDLPTGGQLIENKQTIRSVYETGRGSLRVRARYEIEPLEHGQYQIIITQIPYQVEKGRLVEQLANLLLNKKVPFLSNVLDESTDDIRVVLTPKSRSVDPAVLMSILFKQSDLETRVNLNMNVLNHQNVPRVMNLKEILEEYISHRLVVLKRCSDYRLKEIAHRMEILKGLLIAYLNLDAVIRIIREEDEPKPVMQKKWHLSDVQVEAILNMRLRSLRKLEQLQIQTELDTLEAEAKILNELLSNPSAKMAHLKAEVKEMETQFGDDVVLGPRRTKIEVVEEATFIPLEATVEKESVTIIFTQKGWIRSFKGHSIELDEIKYKDGDELSLMVKTDTTERLLFFGTDGRFYTMRACDVPGGRGFGEPIRMFLDLPPEAEVLLMEPYQEGDKFLVASSTGRGFVVEAASAVAQTKNGKQILNLDDKERALVCHKIAGDTVAVVGENRKMLLFPVADLPTMSRGRGVMLQKYGDGGLSDVKTFTLQTGLTWSNKKKSYQETDLTTWLGRRASAGRLAPTGFSKSNKFGG
ncbi:MAG: DNA topoisomerase IV subunit A [Alphaproteobacteria bacterium RIFCSPHIGHO2_01_FULL_41_14]|nr:MAG: DNA topoisomerase IV subunit A [Alphaproteobacteria bacterium GWB1_45_5]OFW75923.1 MAG: DNA topoisomerase IV subunit A [Alphaproteobacteria bacterium GWA1_45_9]OFW90015.1 MAG: DNA topoisomerase IV subunit A [Alphaproteobacteria bacterium RIFCSPHIGHO2_01_FULL_41_14]HCI49209.1 DNA topoisomerase IV subunit A [Holosporales bacterium]